MILGSGSPEVYLVVLRCIYAFIWLSLCNTAELFMLSERGGSIQDIRYRGEGEC